MGRRVLVRGVTDAERAAVRRLAHSRTAPARAAERARVVLAAVEGASVEGASVEGASVEGASVEEIAVRLHLARNTVYLWLHRFEARGLARLEDAPREGRPPTHSREQVGEIVAVALTAPSALALPFQSWTLDRLVAYLSEPSRNAIADGVYGSWAAKLCGAGAAILDAAAQEHRGTVAVIADRGVEGCVLQLHFLDIAGRGDFIWRCGVLLAADAAAQALVGGVPLASPAVAKNFAL